MEEEEVEELDTKLKTAKAEVAAQNDEVAEEGEEEEQEQKVKRKGNDAENEKDAETCRGMPLQKLTINNGVLCSNIWSRSGNVADIFLKSKQ